MARPKLIFSQSSSLLHVECHCLYWLSYWGTVVFWFLRLCGNRLFLVTFKYSFRDYLNRLQTRDELAKRGIIKSTHDQVCCLSFGTAESHLHLSVATRFWTLLCDWISINPCLDSILQLDRHWKAWYLFRIVSL